MPHRPFRSFPRLATVGRPICRARGFTLNDVVVAIAAVVVFGSGLGLAGLFEAREQASRIKCQSNLRQIMVAAIAYSQNEKSHAFPRTRWNSESTKLITDTTGSSSPASFAATDRPSPVGDNNVTASFYLLLKTQSLDSNVFVCPTTDATPAFTKNSKVKQTDVSNWPAIPQNLSYSYACPFPTMDAVKAGWRFGSVQVGEPVPVVSDMNPGGAALTKVLSSATQAQLKTVNSRNHNGAGQNVAYSDGSVLWHVTPFCGRKLDPVAGAAKGAPDLYDNIYTYGPVTDKSAGDGVIGMPTGADDVVMLPVDAPAAAASGATTKGAAPSR